MKKVLIVNANYYDEITIRLLQEAKKILKKNKINLSIKMSQACLKFLSQ